MGGLSDIAESTPRVPDEELVFDARGITKIYHMGEVDVHALRGVDLDLREGEFVVLLGPVGQRQVDAPQHPRRPRRADARATSSTAAAT